MIDETSTKVGKALDYIAKHPGARSAEIAAATNIEQRNVVVMLKPAVNIGYLVVCEVTSTKGQKAFEYRVSIAGEGMSIGEYRRLRRAEPGLRPYKPDPAVRRVSPALPSAGPAPNVSRSPASVSPPATPEADLAPQPSAPAQSTAGVRPEVAAFAALAAETRPRAHKPGTGGPGRHVFGLWDDGSLAIILPDGRTIEIPTEDTRRLRSFLGALS